MTIGNSLLSIRKIYQRPRRLVITLAMAWIAWVGLTIWNVIIEKPITEAQVSARRIQVDHQKYDQIETRLEAYHRPATPPSLTTSFYRTIEASR